MDVAIITGSAGLIGSEAARFFADQGLRRRRHRQRHARALLRRRRLTRWRAQPLEPTCRGYRHVDADIRDDDAMDAVFARYGRDIALVIHTAAQPSHDWAAREPLTDFTVNANGTLNLLEMTRRYCPDARVHLHAAPTRSTATRRTGCRWSSWRRAGSSTRRTAYAEHGIDETMSIDAAMHSLFGASKVAGRRDGAGIRPLFRHEDRVLPRRLPDRARPFRRGAARLPVAIW